MNRSLPAPQKEWLDIGEAARLLGVHFTTLRRWANAGQIACIRTPGGRRRFQRAELERFVAARRSTHDLQSSTRWELGVRMLDHTRRELAAHQPGSEQWMSRISADQREQLRQTGRQLTALLLQFATRGSNAEVFLEEGRRISATYAQICSSTGMPVGQAVRTFLFFQRSVLDSLAETGALGGLADQEGRQLFVRSSYFFDELIIALVDEYPPSPANSSE